MSSFKITGGRKLKGELVPQGAKNEALQILCAVLLTKEPVIIHNIPNIRDVNKLMELLEDMGVKRSKMGEGVYKFEADDVKFEYFETQEYKNKAAELRGSVMLLGPMLGRFGRGKAPKPGGDKIGRRPLDTHFIGFQKLGAEFSYDPGDSFYSIDGSKMKGSYIWMEEISVTGTANVLMAAVLTEGTTTIYNAACEPYLQQLCKMLNSMGAKISGVGSNLLTIKGVKELHGCEHTMLPDMIEIGSFIGLAAMTGSEITIKNCRIPELGIIPDTFRKLGIEMEFRGDDIHIPAQSNYKISTLIDGSILTVYDAPWPGFTPDLISIILVTAIQAKGTVLIHQKMFESRLFFTDKLIDMGAQIILCDPHRATVIGLDRQYNLRGIRMTSPDIRAGVALLIAALSADGTSIIDNIEQIDRGYQNIDARLNAIGAEIVRV
ncbi:UDP-N-acetylglucosamine 1-carboxyvinyltransferase [Lacihabitans sp. CS3-21]|uniref:UDP-N-acetylglucosamine 1-carboxyvinyltransferase n=1 Tax=Lacihabitans sp. CS3-21 TaxID=2487332 RepID=UPI000BD6437B|nr:UDP-N-acetylglucosamine 1-carboxyvinyltransferase [Lacihabitans sp. CS3-21]MCP9747994.1 UDP-N-acetylglucosamine 1-carboxyvinyltransferase [Lacihabitans sp. CS3-21]OYU64771.1 MAG: UDP-N-acetylglucosamine 1-carboxyvinyltransferase [Cytophagaceae bacterium BCCC1]OYU65524.1 MAG: UDP-N-acetylglucosamine 1-carboxyvinyltransferase [Cytophagaceae bacterium BCCC1]